MEVMNTHQYKKTPSGGLAILTHCIEETLLENLVRSHFWERRQEVCTVHIDNYEIACREISTIITRS
jgi:uncharacterized phosphosugar-binding protein